MNVALYFGGGNARRSCGGQHLSRRAGRPNGAPSANGSVREWEAVAAKRFGSFAPTFSFVSVPQWSYIGRMRDVLPVYGAWSFHRKPGMAVVGRSAAPTQSPGARHCIMKRTGVDVVRSIRNRDHARPPGASGPPALRWRRRLTAGVVTSLAAVGLVAGSVTAASAAPLPPAAGVSPAVVAGGIGPIYFYTAANGTVWTKTADRGCYAGEQREWLSARCPGSSTARASSCSAGAPTTRCGTPPALVPAGVAGPPWAAASPPSPVRCTAAPPPSTRCSRAAPTERSGPATTARPGGAPGTPRAATCTAAPGRPRPTSAASRGSWWPAPTSSSTSRRRA